MPHKTYNIGIAAQISTYSDALEVPGGVRWLFGSGTPGLAEGGMVPEGITAQSELAWENVLRALSEAGMDVEDLVKTTTYLINAADIPAYGKVRARVLGNVRPASMLMVVSQMVRPEFLVEVEAIAAKA